jgi:glycerophosphoryl diester phosphodiesterase
MITALLAACVSLGAPEPAFAPMPPIHHKVAVCCHRGGRALRPENTLAAYRNAIALGADFIEIDVRATVDGHLVISHDRTVDRMTNGHGNVADLTFDYIRSLDAGYKFSDKYKGEKIPTLDEVLDLAKGKINIYLDHKAAPVADVLACLKKHKMTKHVVVYNGTTPLQEWKKLAPEIPVMPGLPEQYRRPGGYADFLKVLHAEVTDGDTSDYTAELVQQAHANGVKVYVDSLGTTDNEEGWQKALDLGVDGIQTDHPDKLIAFLKMKK